MIQRKTHREGLIKLYQGFLLDPTESEHMKNVLRQALKRLVTTKQRPRIIENWVVRQETKWMKGNN